MLKYIVTLIILMNISTMIIAKTDELTSSDEFTRLFNQKLISKLSNGERKGTFKLNASKPFTSIEIPLAGLENYVSNPERYSFNSIEISYDFTNENEVVEVTDCDVNFMQSSSGTIAQPNDLCCNYQPPEDNRLSEDEGKYSISLFNNAELSPELYDANNVFVRNLQYPSGRNMMKVPMGKKLHLKGDYDKNKFGETREFDVYVTIPVGNGSSFEVKIIDGLERYNTNDFGGRFRSHEDKRLTFSEIGLYKVRIYGRWTFGGTEERNVFFWVCVFPEETEDIVGDPVIVNNGCNSTDVTVYEALPSGTYYSYAVSTETTEWPAGGGQLRRPGDPITLHGIAGTTGLVRTYNSCTGTYGPTIKSIQLTPKLVPLPTFSLPVICQGETYSVTGITANVPNQASVIHRWELNGNLVSTNKSVIIAPNGDINSSTSRNAGKLRYIAKVGTCSLYFERDLIIQRAPASPNFQLEKEKFNLDEQIKLSSINTTEDQRILDWGDGVVINQPTSIEDFTHVYNNPGYYTIKHTTSTNEGCEKTFSKQIILYTPLCENTVPIALNGAFKMDKFTGTLVYDLDDCDLRVPITCFNGPGESQEVVSSSAVILNDQWSYENQVFAQSQDGENDYETGEKGKWRLVDSYNYNTKRKYLDEGNQKLLNKNAGTFYQKNFNWQTTGATSKDWLKTSTVNIYTANGDALEEVNALNISNSVLLGYNQSVPILTATNASISEVLFESFESSYQYNGKNYLENNWDYTASSFSRTKERAHSGIYSAKFPGNQALDLPLKEFTSHLRREGMVIQFWISSDELPRQKDFSKNVSVKANLNTGNSILPKEGYPSLVSRVGEWNLIEVEFEFQSVSESQGISSFEIKGLTNHANYWVDDIRYQPFDSEMNGYVYDINSLRLITTFDDRNFGLYYQYNAEGKLVRKKVETERGIRTIQETQYNSPGLIEE